MTDTPDLTPEVVERLATRADVYVIHCAGVEYNLGTTLRALSGERDELKITLAYCEKQWTDTDRVTQEKMIDERKRAEAAEQASRYESDLAEQALQEMRQVRAERDDQKKARLKAVRSWMNAEARAKTLEAELAQAEEVLKEITDRAEFATRYDDDKFNFGWMIRKSRAFLARHKKETDT